MASIMTASSLFLHVFKEFTIFETSIVIQLHIIGMFLPSLFTGDLIKRFGHNKIIISGIFLLSASIFTKYFFSNVYRLRSWFNTIRRRLEFFIFVF